MLKTIDSNRLTKIDFLRSLAIIIMIFANSSPYIFQGPHPIWFRLFCSIAAPLFIFLSGYSFHLSFRINKNKKHKYIQAFYILLSAIFIDTLVWQILPFQTFDVLYLIAFGILINTLIFELNVTIKLSIACIFIIGAFYLNYFVAYRFNIYEQPINLIYPKQIALSNIFEVKRWLIDGWFPLFPWTGVAILGQIFSQKMDILNKYINILKWPTLFILSFFLYLVLQTISPIPERDGYLEIFYPPSPYFICFFLTLIFFLFSFFNNSKINEHRFFMFFGILGRKSMFIYIYHAFIISYMLASFAKPLRPLLFLLVNFIFILSAFVMAYLLEKIEENKLVEFIPKSIKKVLGIR
jgi:uncharacterized membrane protein